MQSYVFNLYKKVSVRVCVEEVTGVGSSSRVAIKNVNVHYVSSAMVCVDLVMTEREQQQQEQQFNLMDAKSLAQELSSHIRSKNADIVQVNVHLDIGEDSLGSSDDASLATAIFRLGA